MKSQSNRSVLIGLFASLVVMLLASGCVSKETVAGMIVNAPNKNYLPEQPAKLTTFWNHFNDGRHSSPFVYLKVKVGPPDAELEVVELPPADYHIKYISGTRTNLLDGKKYLTTKFLEETNAHYTPLKEPATIVLLHGYMMYKETMAPWASELAQAGYRVVLVDLRGHGQSTGETVTYGKYETKDLSRVLDYLKTQGLCDDKIGVLGWSYGGTLALHWAAVDSRVQAVVAIAPYDNFEETAIRLAKELKIPVSHKTMHDALALAAQRLQLKWADWSGEVAIRKLKEPVLLIGGGHDRICVPEDIEKLKKAAPAGTKVIMVPDVNHFVLGFLLHELGEPVKAWFQEQLESQPVASAKIVMGKDSQKKRE